MPLTSVTADSVPCSTGEATDTVAPGSDRPSFDVMVPVITPVWRPWARAPPARPATRARAHATLASTFFIVQSSTEVQSPRHLTRGKRWWEGWTDRLRECGP